jgi:hypothetical protein
MASAHAGHIGLDSLKVMFGDRELQNGSPGDHVASETSRNLKAFDGNEHAPLTKMGKNGSLIFTDLTTVPFELTRNLDSRVATWSPPNRNPKCRHRRAGRSLQLPREE